jgi:hypothetical protein
VVLTTAERIALIEQYAAGSDRLSAALAQIPSEAYQWRPAPGEWSAHEVVIHCADSETNSAARIRYLLTEDDALILGYDEAQWANILDYHALPLEPALATIAAVRANTVPLLQRLPETAWLRAGRHSDSGRYSAEDWLRIYAEHLELHVDQIQKNLAAWRAREV